MKRVFAFIGFTFAITLLLVNIIPFSAVRYITLSLAVLTVISFLIKELRQAKVAVVILCSSTVACLLFSAVYSSVTAPQLELDGTQANAVLTVTSVGKESGSGKFNYTAKISALDGNPCNIRVRLNTDRQLDAEPYDELSCKVKLYSIGDNAYTSYGYYADNIYLFAKLTGSYSVRTPENKPLHYYLIILTQKIKSEIYESFDGDVGALGVSILTGDISTLSDTVYNNFKICGVTHIVAVSGLHTTLICLSVYCMLKLLRCPKLISFAVTAFTLCVYIAVADFSKSAVRAGIMLFVMMLAKLLNSKADALNSLGIAVFILCLNPYAVFDAGAALSVCAVLGILVIFPNLRNENANESKCRKYIFDSVILTISVTFSMLPVMCLYFESVSLVGILLNCIIIPLLQLALLSVCLMLLFCKSILLSFIPEQLAYFALSAMIKITDVFADAFYWMTLSAAENYLLIASALSLILIGLLLVINKTVSVRFVCIMSSVLILLSSVFSVYNSSTAVTVNLLQTGGIIVRDRDTVLALYIDDYYDYSALLSENRNKPCCLVDCDGYSERIAQRFDNVISLGDMSFSDYVLDDKISLCVSEKEVIVTIFDNSFKTDGKNVIINNTMLSGKSLHTLDGNIMFYFKDGGEVRYRYG